MLDLAWYARRLSVMAPGELADKAALVARQAAWRRRAPALPSSHDPTPCFSDPLGVLSWPNDATVLADRVVADAERVMSGSMPILGSPHDRLNPTPDYLFDPSTGHRYGGSEPVSIKHVWELARLQHLPLLGNAYLATDDSRFAHKACADLEAWIETAPFPHGVHWTSGIELGMRLLSVVWTRRLLSGWDDAPTRFEENEAFREHTRRHLQWLDAFPSTGSSANNHRVAELAGIVAATSAFPWSELRPSQGDEAATELAELLRQSTLPSGLNAELASSYHAFVLELGLLAGLERHWRGTSFDGWEPLVAMTLAMSSMSDQHGNPPRQGDGDDSRALLLDGFPDRSPDWKSVLAAGQTVLGIERHTATPSVTALILGQSTPLSVETDPLTLPADLEEDGMVLFASEHLWLRFDAGPHGLAPLGGHAHADALAVEVRWNGLDILADPGTYCYTNDLPMRDHFRSTRAHNTLEVGHRPQSAPGGPFLWSSQASTELLRFHRTTRSGQAVAVHDGYAKAFGVLHRRQVQCEWDGSIITMVDELQPASDQLPSDELPVRLTFQLGPDIDLRLDGSTSLLFHAHEHIASLMLPPQLAWRLAIGSRAPIEGWFSPAFGELLPAPVLIGTGTVATSVPLLTSMGFE